MLELQTVVNNAEFPWNVDISAKKYAIKKESASPQLKNSWKTAVVKDAWSQEKIAPIDAKNFATLVNLVLLIFVKLRWGTIVNVAIGLSLLFANQSLTDHLSNANLIAGSINVRKEWLKHSALRKSLKRTKQEFSLSTILKMPSNLPNWTPSLPPKLRISWPMLCSRRPQDLSLTYLARKETL